MRVYKKVLPEYLVIQIFLKLTGWPITHKKEGSKLR
jgi:hypothetical protein